LRVASGFLRTVTIAASPRLRSARLCWDRHAQTEVTTAMRTTQRVRRAGLATAAAALVIGNPLGLSGSVTQGIISATDRAVTGPSTDGSPAATLPGAIQTSAPINPGNSGGALVSTSGQVVGIPTLAAGSPQGGGQAQGIGFAIPSNLARDI